MTQDSRALINNLVELSTILWYFSTSGEDGLCFSGSEPLADLFERLAELRIDVYFSSYFFTTVKYGGVVSPSQDFTDFA